MKYSTKDIATISLTAALTVVIGYVFYFMGNFLPIPGNKFLIFAPFLGFMMYMAIDRVGKLGVMTAISFVFGFIMGLINISMAIAILVAGITSDLISLVIVRRYDREWKKVISAGVYSPMSFISAFIVSYYFTGNKAFLLITDKIVLIPLILIIYIMGIIGAALSKNIASRI